MTWHAPRTALEAFDRPGAACVVDVLHLDAAGGDELVIAETLSAWRCPAERVVFALGALRSLSPAAVEAVAEAVLADLRGGAPGAPLDSVRAEAELWASTASHGELSCYAWSAFHALPDASRQRFLAAVSQPEREAAA